MQLRNLSGAIRKTSGNVTVGVATPLGYIRVAVQKSDLLEKLKGLSDDPKIETHMEVDADGALRIPTGDTEGRAMTQAVVDKVIADADGGSAAEGVQDPVETTSAADDLDFDLGLDDAAPAAAAATDDIVLDL